MSFEGFTKDKELGEKEILPQTSMLTEEEESEEELQSKEEYTPPVMMDEIAVAEEEQRIFESHIREETKALKIVVTRSISMVSKPFVFEFFVVK